MRNFEMLLLLADLVALVMMTFPRLQDAGWWRPSTIAAMAIAFAQVGVEGPRWQLVPAYVLTLLLFLTSIARRSSAAADGARRVRLTRIAIGCAERSGSPSRLRCRLSFPCSASRRPPGTMRLER